MKRWILGFFRPEWTWHCNDCPAYGRGRISEQVAQVEHAMGLQHNTFGTGPGVVR